MTSDTTPHPLSREEWLELMSLPEVRESWGLEEGETPEHFASMVYAARFDFVSGHPGYVGKLYMVQGDTLTGDTPFVFIRDRAGKLVFAYDN